MGTRKKSTELIFNLQWRNNPDNGGDKNIIGMYDTPTTTSNFEKFKSYLLKNSGVAENDVKVTYITDSGHEWIIDSQVEFELALGAFRLKARLGEVIFLKLDKVSNGRHQMIRKHSNDVETQFDLNSMENDEVTPPKWFVTYMKQFKRDIVEEVTYNVSSNLSANRKEKESIPIVITNTKKIKPETSKRSKKHLVLGETPIDKELLKTLKYDRKLENKLDKLDAMTKKIKEKKQALLNKIEIDNDEFCHLNINAKPSVSFVTDPEEQKDFKDVEKNLDENTTLSTPKLLRGSAVNSRICQRLIGGEIYLQTWEVINNGNVPWSSNIQLKLTWGSANLSSSAKVLQCPLLKVGERGFISVTFEMPTVPGTYESYWNFYDGDIRFGQSLSCCFIVEEPLKLINYPHLVTCQYGKYPFKTVEKPEPEVVNQCGFNEIRLTSPVETKNEIQLQSQAANTEDVFYIKQGDVSPILTKPLIKIPYVPEDQNNGTSSEGSLNDKSRSSSKESFEVLQGESTPLLTSSVMNLSKKIENIKLSDSNLDSDSDWESVCSLEKHRLAEGILTSPTNRYGIQEKDLIVDLSMNSKEKAENNPVCSEKQGPEENALFVGIEDNNNNNGVSMETIWADYVMLPRCEEKEESSGYVYITIDGNKLPVPKHILCSDFLRTAEEAPAPVFSEDERPVEKKQEPKPEDKPNTPVKLDAKQQLQSDIVMDSAQAAQCLEHLAMSESTNRLFIFPQNNPGFEVVHTNQPYCPQNITEETGEIYTWAKSPTQYRINPAHNTNPYGPLDHSRSPPCPDCHSSPSKEQTASAPIPQNCFATTAGLSGQNTTYAHVPNYQQAAPTPLVFTPETPSAPPHKPQEHNVPVHILPENLVSGAVNVASSAINTARSVINMIVPPRTEPGKWVSGHWVTDNPESLRAKNLVILAEMGFWDTDLNATLLARYNDDINRVINELVQ